MVAKKNAHTFTCLSQEEIELALHHRGLFRGRFNNLCWSLPSDEQGAAEKVDVEAKERGLAAILDQRFSTAAWDALVAHFAGWSDAEGRAAGLAVLHARIDAWVGQCGPAPATAVDLAGLWRAEVIYGENGEGEAPGELDCDDAFAWRRSDGLLCFLELRGDGTYREVDLSIHPLRYRVTHCTEIDHGGCTDDGADPDEFAEHEAHTEQPGLVCAIAGYASDIHVRGRPGVSPYLLADTRGFSRIEDGTAFAKGATKLNLREGEHDGGIIFDRVRSTGADTLEREAFQRWDGIYCEHARFEYRRFAHLPIPRERRASSR